MMKAMKKALSVILVVVIMLTAAPLSRFVGLEFPDLLDFSIKADAKSLSEYDVGDIIEFGSYPQSEVVDESLIAELNTLQLNWISYEYYSGTGSWSDGRMQPSNYMKYADVVYNEDRYRAVTIEQYRPSSTGYKNASNYRYQDINGYSTNTIYWFKYEPLDWFVLDPDEGFIVSKNIIDSQAYNNVVYCYNGEYYQSTSCDAYANDYVTSTIRKWLNDDFYNTAFTSIEKDEIQKSLQENNCYNSSYPKYNSDTTYDKVFFLSYNDVLNSNYGFSSSSQTFDKTRQVQGSDYAKCQGLRVHTNGMSTWLLRSPYSVSHSICLVGSTGTTDTPGYVNDTNYGIRPALKLNPKSNATSDYKSIAVFSTSKSFKVKTGENMWLGFGIMVDGKLDGNWEKMAVTVSDTTVASLSAYEETEYGYSLEVIGKKEGSTNLTITDAKTGLSTTIVVNVFDEYTESYSYDISDMVYFYPNNEWEHSIKTNIYDMNGIYLNNYSCIKSENKYYVSFDVYNQRYHHGAIDVYDGDGNWISSEQVEKYSNISSIYDTGEQIYYLITDGNWLTYQHAMHSKKTHIEIEVPEGGYFTISNNFAESVGCFLYNSCEILYEGASVAIDAFTDDVETPFIDLISGKIIDKEPTRKLFHEMFIRAGDKEIREYSKNILNGNVDDAYSSISGLLENMLYSLELNWKHLLGLVSGLGESVFEKFSGPAGLALKGCFAMSEFANKTLQAQHIAQSIDEAYVTVYSSINEGYINPHIDLKQKEQLRYTISELSKDIDRYNKISEELIVKR